MNYREAVDPELGKNARSFPFNRFIIAAGNYYQLLSWHFTGVTESIREEVMETRGHRGLSLKTTVFSPAGESGKAPALIYIHGGAFVYRAAPYHKKLACIYAERAGCRVFFPHYHLAPKYQYPAAYEDVLSLYRYVAAHAEELGVDAERIGIGGDSAGGALAALVCDRCEAERVPVPCLQMLVYPLTDAEITDSMRRFRDTPQWDSQANERMWFYYCGDDRERRYDAAPMRCDLPGAIPRTYIETAEFDCLHDEGLLYGEKLKSAGARVEINDTKGTYHGYDTAIDAQIVKRNIDRRVSFLRDGFAEAAGRRQA